MGIGPSTLEFLMREHKERRFGGKVLTLGRQDVEFTKDYLYAHAHKVVANLEPIVPVTLSRKKHYADAGKISDVFLFKSFGCTELQAMDISTYEEADIIWDLNNPDVPDNCKNAFDMIFDGGTTEHVFNVPNALRNVQSMVKVGGRILHVLPASNYVNHGYYQFSPMLLYDYYRANKYTVHDIYMHSIERNLINSVVGEFFKCQPDQIRSYFPAGGDRVLWMVLMSATRNADSTCGKAPFQNF